MPRRNLLSAEERIQLLAMPASLDEIIRCYTFSEADLAFIRQHRGAANRLGCAVQLCYLRFPGISLGVEQPPFPPLLQWVAEQLKLSADGWEDYGRREQTRREHLLELQAWLQLRLFSVEDHPRCVADLAELAFQTDQGMALAEALVVSLRQQRIIVPAMDVIERICSEALSLGTRQLYQAMTASLSIAHCHALDNLLKTKSGSRESGLMWLRQPPGAPKPKHILAHLARLNSLQALGFPAELGKAIHQNRLLKLAREGSQMTAQHLRDLAPVRRFATLVAILIETRATLIDETLDLHDRFLGSLFNQAKRRHAERFQESGKAINDKVRLYLQIGRALLAAKDAGTDPFAAIETVLSWEAFAASLNEAEQLARPAHFDYLALMEEGFDKLRRYTPTLLQSLELKAAPVARELLEAVQVLKRMHARQARKVPEDAPTAFIRKRWENLVVTDEGLDRRFYELCVLTELKNALRSGDIWVLHSRQFKDFEEYLLPPAHFREQLRQHELGLDIETDCERYLESRLTLLRERLATVEQLAAADELPDACIMPSGRLKITPLDNAVPDEAEALLRTAYALLPHLKITELLMEVDDWTGFTRHFTHLKNEEEASDRSLLLTAILADAINLGLSKMAESCPGVTYAKLTWLQAWHIRDETYSAALAELVNAQSRQPFAAHWGEGTTSSSDGQYFKAGGHGQVSGQVNLKHGQEPGVQFYTHISDQYAPYHIKVIHAAARDATYVLDGLLYHESDLRIEEHYTDTAGFTDHVFALMPPLGFRFAPRIRDLADKRLYIPGDASAYPTLASLIGGTLNLQHIRAHWDEILRLVASIKQGTVTASLMLRKLGSYPRQNGLAVALRELGRIERTLFTLDWIQSVDLRRRVQVGLNKGEARNALTRAVFLNRLGEIRDRSFENQRYRASGLNLVVAAIILWNTVYLEQAVKQLAEQGIAIPPEFLPHFSPLGWEHINLTGDYIWRQSRKLEQGQLRPLRTPGAQK